MPSGAEGHRCVISVGSGARNWLPCLGPPHRDRFHLVLKSTDRSHIRRHNRLKQLAKMAHRHNYCDMVDVIFIHRDKHLEDKLFLPICHPQSAERQNFAEHPDTTIGN